MTETMKAMVLTGHGGPEKLVWHEDWPKPAPGSGEVLVRVSACGLNNTDINTRTGWYARDVTGATEEGAEAGDSGWGGALTFPRIQGADVAGVVEAVGDGADPALVGRRVLIDTWLRDWDDPLNLDKTGYYGSERDGGFAEFTTVDARNVHPVESDLTDAELATFSTSYVTAENMLDRASVGADDVVLVTGASGGVGSALVQLAKRRGAKVVALCGASKADQVRALGPDAVLDRAPADLPGALRAAIARETVTVAADIVGGDHWPRVIEVIARGGRYVCSGAIAGPMVEFDLRTFYLNDLSFHGATAARPGIFSNLVGYIERGEIRPLLAGTWPLKELGAAQEAFVRKEHVGNFVVIP